jgi:uncharacterized membrane protein YgcG
VRVRIVLGVFAALVLGWSGSASAEKKRVAVPRFDGPQEGIVRKAVMQVLKGDGYDVVGAKEIDGASKSTGAQLDSNEGFKTVAKELSISAFVTGEVSKKKAKLTVRNGADGSVSGEGAFGGANVAKIAADVRDGFSRRLGSAVERGRAPTGAKKPTAAPVAEADDTDDNAGAASGGGGGSDQAPPPKPAASKAAPAATEEAPPPASESSGSPEETVAKKAPEPEGEPMTGPRALDLGISFGGFSRDLSYHQLVPVPAGSPTVGARSYNLPIGPVLSLKAIAYPLGFMTGTFAANIGVEGNINQTFAVSGSTPTGGTLNTVIHDYYGGVRLRLMLAGGHEVAVFGGGGEHAFAFRDGPAGPNSPDARGPVSIPDTIYRYARGGVDAKFELPSGMTARVAGAYRYVLNRGGQIGDGAYSYTDTMNVMHTVPGFFPYLTVGGVDFQAELGYHVTPSIEARLGVNLTRYFFAMNSAPGDFFPAANTPCPCNAAGGAVDQYLGFSIGAAYIFGGVQPGVSGSSDEPAPPPKKKKHKKKKGGDDEAGDAGDASGGGDSGGGDQGGGDADE